MSKFTLSGSMLAGVAAALMASASFADTVSGPGGAIPAAGTGGGGTWQSALPPSPFQSTVNVPIAIASINSITFTAMSHTWIGDLQAVLFDPNGNGYNIFVRPGSVNGSVGNSGDFLGGNYTFFDPISGNPQLPASGNAAAGNYSQSYGEWINGNHSISNLGMNSISGAAGTWTLRIYDWAGGDVGTLSGWTLDYTPIPAPGALALLGLAGLAAGRRRRA